MQQSTQPGSIFIGDDGLRAGWSIAIFLAPFLLLFGIGWLFIHLLGLGTMPVAPHDISPSAVIFAEGLQLFFVVVAALVMSLIERRPFSRYGLTTRRMLPDFAAGLGWGLLMLSLLIVALRLTHAIAFDGLALHGPAAIAYALKWAIAFLIVGIFEEFCFRGYLQFTLSRGIAGIVRAVSPLNPDSHLIGFVVSAFVLSVCIFAYTHTANGGETLVGILAVACAGSVFAFSLWRTGSLWWAIGFHSAWDWAQSYLYGTPDSGSLAQGHLLATHPLGPTHLSGGSAGPEGSILVIPTLLLVAIVIHFTLPRRDYPLTPDQSAPAESPPERKMSPHPQSTA